MSKTVTVVIPIYNVEKYLNRCIESVVGQTYENLEIILVDDESPDNCPQICEDWKNRDNRIKVVHKRMLAWDTQEILASIVQLESISVLLIATIMLLQIWLKNI